MLLSKALWRTRRQSRQPKIQLMFKVFQKQISLSITINNLMKMPHNLWKSQIVQVHMVKHHSQKLQQALVLSTVTTLTILGIANTRKRRDENVNFCIKKPLDAGLTATVIEKSACTLIVRLLIDMVKTINRFLF